MRVSTVHSSHNEEKNKLLLTQYPSGTEKSSLQLFPRSTKIHIYQQDASSSSLSRKILTLAGEKSDNI